MKTYPLKDLHRIFIEALCIIAKFGNNANVHQQQNGQRLVKYHTGIQGQMIATCNMDDSHRHNASGRETEKKMHPV